MTDITDFHSISNIDDCRLITLEKHHHENGNLSFVENNRQLPFDINRVYYIYDVPGGAERGGHSHKQCAIFLLAVSGSFDVEITDGVNSRTFTLNRSNIGLYIAPGIWRVLTNFSSGSVALSIASRKYEPEDYIYEYDVFIEATSCKRK